MPTITLNKAERKELIIALVANCAGWDQEDLEVLTNMSDNKLWAHAQGCAQLITNAEDEDSGLPDTLEPSSAQETESAASDAEDEETVEGDEGEAGVTKTEPDEEKDQPKKCWDEDGNEIECEGETASGENVTENQYIASMPPRIRSVVLNALKFEQAQKKQLVGQITANKRNRFSEQYLMNMGVDELQALSELAMPRQRQHSVYTGAAGGPVHNEMDIDRDDILTIPVLEFSKN